MVRERLGAILCNKTDFTLNDQVLLDPGRRNLYDRHYLLSLPAVAQEDQERSGMALMARRRLPVGGSCGRNHQVHPLCPPLYFLCKEIKVRFISIS